MTSLGSRCTNFQLKVCPVTENCVSTGDKQTCREVERKKKTKKNKQKTKKCNAWKDLQSGCKPHILISEY